jgi:tRNA modification GTPase
LRKLVWQGDVLDEAIVLRFAEGQSYTGEKMAELQLHGSRASVSAVSGALAALGLRPATPGEFTRRAMENGKMDLAQVEGLANLIDAETEMQRRQAVRVLSGALGEVAATIRSHLVRASALMAALIDFSEEDLSETLLFEILKEIGAAQDILRDELVGAPMAERIRDGFEVAIVGAPNVGKSTLLNTLSGRDVALISAIAGTTRDVIEVRMDLSGMAVTLLDTAGIRETEDPVESMGVSRALMRAESADMRLWITDGGEIDSRRIHIGDIIVRTKSDLGGQMDVGLAVSSRTGEGISDLIAGITRELEGRVAGASSVVSERQRHALRRAEGCLREAALELGSGVLGLDVAADSVRTAMLALDALVGRIDVEDILGQIFSTFCIGK